MKFPVNSLLAGNLAFSETSSQLTLPSSGESLANSIHGFGDPPPATRDFALSVALRDSVIDAWDRQR